MDKPDKPLTDDKLTALLFKDMDVELDAIKFYLVSLEDLNYAENKQMIDHLVLDSIIHIEILTKHLLLCGPVKKTTINERTRALALKEETTMKELYVYLSNKTNDESLKRTLRTISTMEDEHERFAKELK